MTLWWSLRLRLLWIVFFVFLGFLGRGLLLGTSNLIGLWVDQLITQTEAQWYGIALLNWLIGSASLGLLVTWIYRIGFSDMCALMVSKIYDEVTLRTSRYPMSFFDSNPVGRVVTRFSSDYGQVFRLFGGPLAEFLSILFDLVWMLMLLTLANFRFLPFLMLSIALHIFMYRQFKPRLKRQRKQLSVLRSPSLAHFAESTQGATPIRIFGREASFKNRFQSLDLEYLEQKQKTVWTTTRFTLWLNSLSFLLYTGLALFSWWGLAHQKITIGDMGIAFGLVALSGNTVQMFFEWLAQFEEAIVGLERLDDYLRRPLEMGALLPAGAQFPTPEHQCNRFKASDLSPDNPPARPAGGGVIKFENVWFRYSADLPWVLKDINVEFPLKGARIGIIGRTGAGKSTFISTLLQLYPIEKGQLHIDTFTLPYRSLTPDDSLEQIRNFFGVIPQDPFIFQASLQENLDPSLTIPASMIQALLIRLGKGEWAQQLTTFQLEEKGKNLSAGEKQILQLARVLIQNRPVLILDEATSNIDPQTEQLMVQVLNQDLSHRLQLIVAHRLSTLQNCTHILWLEQGQVYRFGQPAEILSAFKNQHDLQGVLA